MEGPGGRLRGYSRTFILQITSITFTLIRYVIRSTTSADDNDFDIDLLYLLFPQPEARLLVSPTGEPGEGL